MAQFSAIMCVLPGRRRHQRLREVLHALLGARNVIHQKSSIDRVSEVFVCTQRGNGNVSLSRLSTLPEPRHCSQSLHAVRCNGWMDERINGVSHQESRHLTPRHMNAATLEYNGDDDNDLFVQSAHGEYDVRCEALFYYLTSIMLNTRPGNK